MAACVFAIPELKLLLLTHIGPDVPSLARLCRVSKAFHASLTPALYKCVHFSTVTEHALRRVDDAPRSHNGRWAFTRALLAHDVGDLDDHDPDIVPHQLNKGLAIILRHAQNLEAFCYTLADLSHDSLDQLAKIATLRHVRIAFSPTSQEDIGIGSADGDEQPEIWAQHGALFGTPQPHFGALSNLTSLSLLDMFGDLQPLSEAIARVLAQSLGMERLCLSIGETCYERTISFDTGYDDLYEFTDRLCDIYAAQTSQRLLLRELNMGTFVAFPSLKCLDKLTNLEVLEEIGIYNVVSQYSEFDIPYEVLTTSKAPALRRISFAELTNSTWDNLDSFCDGSRTLQLLFDSCRVLVEEHSLYSIFADHPAAVFHELRLPDGNAEQTKSPRLELLHGHKTLRNFALPLAIHKLADDGGALLEACVELVGSLPNLQGLWLMGSVDQHHAADEYTPIAVQIALNCASLRYIKIGQLAWAVERQPETCLVQLSEAEGRAAAPKLFDTWSQDQFQKEYIF
ncbi:hypothetical protein PWT90_05050 [Aphanocladium album]|nr:hypothetical protein PWT90_05050 [Aphanocladium album]